MKTENMQRERYFWLDNETFLYEIGLFTDDEGDEYSIEVEYWVDQDCWSFNRIYEWDTIPVPYEEWSEDYRSEIKSKMKKWMEDK